MPGAQSSVWDQVHVPSASELSSFPETSNSSPFSTSDLIQRAAKKYAIDPKLLSSVAKIESDLDPRAVSSAGAEGVMQLMPGTQKDYGVKNPFNSAQNVNAGAKYLRSLIQKYGDKKAALAAYNWGPANVDAARRKYGKNWLNYAPEETQNYVQKVMEDSGNKPSSAQSSVWDQVHEPSQQVPQGNAFERFGEGVVKGTESLGQSVLDLLNPTVPVFTNEPTLHIGPGKPALREKKSAPKATLTGRYIKGPSEREEQIALQEIRSGHPVSGAVHMAAAAIPVVGPGVAGLEEEAAKGNLAGALGESVPYVIAGKAAEGELPGEGLLDKVKEAWKSTPKEISRVASPGLEQAAADTKGMLNEALTNAEGRTKPLFENIANADKERIEQEGAPGSIDVSKPLDELNKEYIRRYGTTEAPRLIASVSKSLENMTNGTLALADMTTARALRSAISNAIDIAKSRGDRPIAAVLTTSRQVLTDAMKDRADQLGLGSDFKVADAQWREIQDAREKLSEILDQKDSRKVLSDLRKGSPEVKNAISKLSQYGLLDKSRVEDLADKAEKISKATGKVYMDWFKRMAVGYLPAGVLLYLGQKYGIIPHTPIDWMIRYGGGMGGASVVDLAKTRLEGMEAAKGLPHLSPEGPGFSSYSPSTPTPFTPPPGKEAPRTLPESAAIPRMAAPAPQDVIGGENVPLPLRPGPFESPWEDAFSQIIQEDEARSKENAAMDALEKELRQQMEKAAEKKRALYRTQEAMKSYKKR